MSTLRLVLLLVACIGPAVVYRLADPLRASAATDPRARRLNSGLLATAIAGIALIALRYPLRETPGSLLLCAAVCALAVIVSALAWRAMHERAPTGARAIATRLIAPTFGSVACIMLAAFLAIPTGWRWF